MPTSEVMREIRRATRSNGVAAARQFRLTNDQLVRACAAGVLERRFRGVYADPAFPHSSRFAYPALKLAIEIDGYEERDSLTSLAADTRRQNLLVLEGWTILRFTWLDIVLDPDTVARQILAALAALGVSRGA